MSQAARILLALVAGLVLGIAGSNLEASWTAHAAAVAEPVGGIWLDALRMTIVPLVVALLITGIAASAQAARASRLAARAILFFLVILGLSSILAALMVPLLFDLFPMPAASAAALRNVLSASGQRVGEVPGFGAFLRSIVPTNPIAAAAGDQILPLIFFTTVFSFALLRLGEEPRLLLTRFFKAIADTMLVIIAWVLWLAPIGVFALAFVVGARAGAAAFGALFHYVLVLSSLGFVILVAAYPLAMIGGRLKLIPFARAVAPAQAVAISTQSSLASLPAMLRGAEALGVPVAASGVVLPLAVAVFRATGPAMNLGVALYVAHWYGIHLGPAQIAAGIALGATTTIGSVSLPGQLSFITAIAPICLAMGIPIEPLVLLVPIEPIPDIFRTLGNVTMNVAVTAAAARRSGFEAGAGGTGTDRLLGEDAATK
jgi:Na+/H+-dicarboxylate symporter